MRWGLFTLIFVCMGFAGSRPSRVYNIPVVMDIDFIGVKFMYDKPGGHIIRDLQHDLQEEDFVVFTIHDKNDTMFYVSAEYSIKGHIGAGWITKDNVVGIYSRAYNQPLRLYNEPSVKSGIRCTMSEYNPGLYTVTDCCEKWLKVSIESDSRVYEGWMEPNMQCANPYSTCN